MLPDPTLGTVAIGPLSLQPFGFLVGVAIIAGVLVSVRQAERWKLDPKVLTDTIVWTVGLGFLGSSVFEVLAYHPEKMVGDPLVLLRFWEQMSSLGGFIGGIAGCLLFLRRAKVSVWPTLDVIAFGFAVAWIFGRLGCTVAYDHPGHLTDFFLGMQYPADRALAAGVRHNLGFYEVFWSLAVTGLFFWARRTPRFSGWYLLTFLIAYIPFRFPLDFLRANDAAYLGLTPAQLVMIPILPVCLALYQKRKQAGEMLGALPPKPSKPTKQRSK